MVVLNPTGPRKYRPAAQWRRQPAAGHWDTWDLDFHTFMFSFHFELSDSDCVWLPV